MSSKKIFIAVGIIVIVVISVIVLYFLFQKKKAVLQEQTQNQEITIPASLPSGIGSSMSQENVAEARKIFENITRETVSDETKKEGSKKIDFKNQAGSPIPLSDFEKGLGVEISPKLKGYLDDGYQIFYCPGSDGKKEFGLYLEYSQDKIYRGFTYNVLDMTKGWEGTIFPNLHAVLFPDVDFSEDSLNQKIQFRDGKYRYAEVGLPGGEKSSIQYKAIECGIIVSTSPSCLDNAYQYYEPSEPY